MGNTKVCTKCGRELPLDCFGKDKSRKDGIACWCKECNAKHSKEFYHMHPEKAKAYAEKNKKRIKGNRHNRYLKKREIRNSNLVYTIYLRTNKVNGMQYVGQTMDFEQREIQWNAPSHRYSNKLITADRFKYGLENWTVDILAIVDSRDEAWELEQKYIKELNTKYPNGYNFGSGGYSNKDVYVSEETKKRMSDRMKELLKDPTNHPMYGRKGKDSPLYGIKRSEETKRKISEANKGKKMSEESIRKMAQKLKELHIIPPTAFEKGHTPWNKGKKMPEEMVDKMVKQLYQYTLNDEYVKLWNSVKEAKEAGFHHADAVARGERKQDKGYKFYYEPL